LDKETGVSPSVGYRQTDAPAHAVVNRDELERDVVSRLAGMEDIVVSEIDLDTNQSRVTIRGISDQPGVAAEVFGAVAEGGVMVDMIVQNLSHDRIADLSFTVPRQDLERCLLLMRELLERWPSAELSFDKEIALLSVMGIGLRSHTGVGEKMFRALAETGVNVQMVNTSETRIGVVVSPVHAEMAHAALLKEFGLNR
jgi:aspartate kinase